MNDPLPYIGISILRIGVGLLALLIGIIIVQILGMLIQNSLTRTKMSKLQAKFFARIIKIFLYVFAVGLALGLVGLNVGAALVSLSVVMGFVLGFALSDTLSNVASGFMIAITKPFSDGDWVEIAGNEGTVKTVRISNTEIDTGDNKRIIFPNKEVWGNPITNYNANDTRRVDLEMGVGYADKLDDVIKVTMDIVKSHEKVLDKPDPLVAVHTLGDNAVILRVRPWVKTSDYWAVYYDLTKKLKQEYDAKGFDIPYPHMDVTLLNQPQD